MSFIQRVDSSAPPGYETPAFPSLYWPLPAGLTTHYFLYDPSDIWRFTTIWTLLFFGTVHLTVAAWACIVQWRNWKIIWMTPVVYAIIAGTEGIIAGSIVGGLLGGVYQAGYFRMSTWIPFVWALVNTLFPMADSTFVPNEQAPLDQSK